MSSLHWTNNRDEIGGKPQPRKFNSLRIYFPSSEINNHNNQPHVSVSSYIIMRGEHSTNTNLNHHRDAPPHTTTMAAHQYNTIYNIITPHHEVNKPSSIPPPRCRRMIT